MAIRWHNARQCLELGESPIGANIAPQLPSPRRREPITGAKVRASSHLSFPRRRESMRARNAGPACICRGFPLSRQRRCGTARERVARTFAPVTGTHGNLLPPWVFWAAMASRIRGSDAKPLATFRYVSSADGGISPHPGCQPGQAQRRFRARSRAAWAHALPACLGLGTGMRPHIERQQSFWAPNRGENITLLWKVCTPNCLSAANLAFDGFVNTRKARGKYHGSEETSS
jgi:hypothetical protein